MILGTTRDEYSSLIDLIVPEGVVTEEHYKKTVELWSLEAHLERPRALPARELREPRVALAAIVSDQVIKRRTVKKAKRKIKREREDQQQISGLMDVLSNSQDPVQSFIDFASQAFGDLPILFFKHLPAYFTLSVTHSSVIPMGQVRGVGLNLKEEITGDYSNLLKDPSQLPSLKTLLFELFNSRNFETYSIETEEGVAGVIVTLQALEDVSSRRLFETLVRVFQIQYANVCLKKLLHGQAIRDQVTGLHNKKYFELKLHEEISRARRIESPVSLVSVGIDHFGEFVENNGQALGDIILKTCASLIKRTSRTIDVLARVGPSEFVMILPHTSKVGAATKAEKLRRLVELTKFPQRESQPGGRITVSIGVSEYPSLSQDAESLVQSSDSAFYQVQKISNKVCLAAAPEGMKPDFEARS